VDIPGRVFTLFRQEGQNSFSVSTSNRRKCAFKEEYLELLEMHGPGHDVKHVPG
jgi:hypothetical protein